VRASIGFPRVSLPSSLAIHRARATRPDNSIASTKDDDDVDAALTSLSSSSSSRNAARRRASRCRRRESHRRDGVVDGYETTPTRSAVISTRELVTITLPLETSLHDARDFNRVHRSNEPRSRGLKLACSAVRCGIQRDIRSRVGVVVHGDDDDDVDHIHKGFFGDLHRALDASV